MQVDEVITKSDRFAHEFVKTILDDTTTIASRQAYMLDNQEKVKTIMESLQKIITAYNDKIEQGETLDEDDEAALKKTQMIMDDLKNALDEFKEKLEIDMDVKEEDITPVVNEKTIGEAMENNSTTKKIASDLKNVQDTAEMPYNYALSCDGIVTLITVKNKNELNQSINAIANKGSFKKIKLFKLVATPVPLKQKTILSV